jgi:group I intron endonuclease
MTCGIYQIINTVNGKIYIGSSCDIEHRWLAHRSGLRRFSHRNKYLQRAWNQHKESNFKLQILEICSLEDLIVIEQYYLDWLEPFRDRGYNLAQDAQAPSRGKPPSNKGKPMNEEQKKKISIALKGKPSTRKGIPQTEKIKQQISTTLQGHFVSQETREKIRLSKIGIRQTEEAKKKKSLALKGRVFSEETKAKISAALKGEKNPRYGKPSPQKGKPANEKQRAALDRTGCPSPNKGKLMSEEQKEKISKTKREQKLIPWNKGLKIKIDSLQESNLEV